MLVEWEVAMVAAIITEGPGEGGVSVESVLVWEYRWRPEAGRGPRRDGFCPPEKNKFELQRASATPPPWATD